MSASGKVLVPEQGVAPAKFLGHCLVEVNHHVAAGPVVIALR